MPIVLIIKLNGSFNGAFNAIMVGCRMRTKLLSSTIEIIISFSYKYLGLRIYLDVQFISYSVCTYILWVIFFYELNSDLSIRVTRRKTFSTSVHEFVIWMFVEVDARNPTQRAVVVGICLWELGHFTSGNIHEQTKILNSEIRH